MRQLPRVDIVPWLTFRSLSEETANLECQGKTINNEAMRKMQLYSLTGGVHC